ncbi:DUF3093 domain-containing protein [Nocardioidaceae bacterium]|nr:DUF3093 domain-containing protein [Nocardioidaceae bacterium]
MSAPSAPEGPTTLYRERLAVPLRWWVQGTMFVASVFLAVVVALPFAGALVVTVVASAIVYGGMVWFGSAIVEVRTHGPGEGDLLAGRGRLPVHVITSVEQLDRERTRAVAGREADARAFLVLRGWLKQAVRVHLADPRDPTPYWLVSTRHPEQLVAALREARQTGPVAGSHGAPPAG